MPTGLHRSTNIFKSASTYLIQITEYGTDLILGGFVLRIVENSFLKI
jgi:hypothetical protein